MSSASVLMNHTLATPLSKMEELILIPLNNISSHPVSNYTINNSTVYNQYCPDCLPNYVTIGPPLITYSLSYSYAYYVFLLILLIAAIVFIKIGISRRKLERRAAAQRRRARQQVESVYVQATSDNNNNTSNTAAKEVDLPPTYEDVIQSCILTKQQQQSAENTLIERATGLATNSSTNTISETISTLTIETEISNNTQASDVHVNNPTNLH